MENNSTRNSPGMQTTYVILWRITAWAGRQKQIIAQCNRLTLNVLQHTQVEVLRRLPRVRKGQVVVFRKEAHSNHTGALANQALGDDIGFISKCSDCSLNTLSCFITHAR